MAVLERDKLYKDVWSRPCTKIAAELGISSSALKRICKEMDIPTPVAGYWTRVQCGKKVSKDPLPKAKKQTRLTWDVDLVNSKRQKTERVRKQKEVQEVAEMVETQALPLITIAADLENLHPLVKATRTQLREAWSRKDWDQRKERKRFSTNISEDALDRALLFLDAFARGVEALGLKFRCQLDEAQPSRNQQRYGNYGDERGKGICWIEASGERVTFFLRERNKRVTYEDAAERKRNWRSTYEDVPSGVFEFSIDAGWGFKRTSTWKDGKIQRIESCLDQIVATIPLAGEFLKQELLRREEEERRRKELEELRYRMDAIKRKEKEAVEVLEAQSKTHRCAKDLRAYIEAASDLYWKEHGQAPEENTPADLWFKWAEVRLRHLDPLGEGFRPWNGQAFRQISGLFPHS